MHVKDGDFQSFRASVEVTGGRQKLGTWPVTCHCSCEVWLLGGACTAAREPEPHFTRDSVLDPSYAPTLLAALLNSLVSKPTCTDRCM